MDSETTLAKRTRVRRTELGKTQQQVAERVNSRGVVKVTRRDISRVETGELITPHFLEDLAIALEVSGIWLASGMTAREHEQLLAGTAVAAGFGMSGVLGQMGEVDATMQEIERERAIVRRLLLVLVWFGIFGLIFYWGSQL